MKKINRRNLPNLIYIVLFLVMSLIPLVAFSDRQAAIGNETKAEKPSLSDGTAFTEKADEYIAQNFGFRNRLVYAGNMLKKSLFKTSGQSDVIVGEDGWLFYSRALEDFLGTSVLDEVSLDRSCAVVLMMQEYVEREGGDFFFVSAPNKMSVYGEYMPYYYMEGSGQGNYELLYGRLLDAGVHTVQLKNILTLEKLGGVQLYHKLDSHWNNYGAAVAYEAVADALTAVYGSSYEGYTSYSGLPYELRESFSGDLQSMLLPGSKKKDVQAEFAVQESFEYTSRFRGEDDLVISTSNAAAPVEKSVTLFRDSFGNALYWFFANEYSSLNAKREIPYNIYQAASGSGLVVVELVERNLKNLLSYTPVVPSLRLSESYFEGSVSCREEEAEAVVSITTTSDGLLQISGSCAALAEYAYIYMEAEVMEADCANTAVYQVLPGENGGDFMLYLEGEDVDIMKNALASENSASGTFAFIVRSGENYEKFPVNLTLQD